MHGHGIAENIKAWIIGGVILIVVAYASPSFNAIWNSIDFTALGALSQAGATIFPYVFVVIGGLIFYWVVIKRE